MPADMTDLKECADCGAAVPSANVQKHKRWHRTEIAWNVHKAENDVRQSKRAQPKRPDF